MAEAALFRRNVGSGLVPVHGPSFGLGFYVVNNRPQTCGLIRSLEVMKRILMAVALVLVGYIVAKKTPLTLPLIG